MLPAKDNFNMEEIARKYMGQVLEKLQENADFKLVITVSQLAKLLNINQTKAYELTRQEGFPRLILGRKIIVPLIPLMSWIETEANRPLNEQLTGLGQKRPRRAKRLK